MISSRRLAQMARKWMKAAAAGRKKLAFRRAGAPMALESESFSAPAPARKGCFVVYSNNGQRFEVPLAYLKSDIFAELLRMSEDVFGLPGAGPITLPCDAAFMDTVISCLQRRSSGDAERVLLASMVARPCSATITPCSLITPQLVVCGC